LRIRARTVVTVPLALRTPNTRTLAPRYIFDETPALKATSLLFERIAVHAEDLSHFHIKLVNFTEEDVFLPCGFELASASRVWDPGRDITPDRKVTEANKLTARAFNRVQKLDTNRVVAGVQLRLDDMDPKQNKGWKGRRYDPTNTEHVEELLKILALDTMEFSGNESEEVRRTRVRKLLVDHIDVFAADNLCPGVADFEPMQINLKDPDQKPIRSAPYRTTPLYRDFIAEQIEKLLKAGSLKTSYGPWASPVAVVRHPTGKLRMVCDYRRLNTATKIDAHPLPDMEVILQQLGEMVFFSCVDLCSGYHQMALDDASQEMTAITTHLGIFEWTVTPFGLASAPSHFSRAVGAILAGMTYRNAVSFIDDILIYSRTFDDHVRDLTEFFGRLQRYHVSLKPSKCDFFAQTASYLGFTLSRDGIEPVKQKVQAINDIAAPKTLTQLRSFIQMVNFYRRFIPGMSSLAKPLTDATRKENLPFQGWLPGSPCDKSFIQLKETLTKAPLLRHARDDLAFVIEVDASIVGFGAVLSQDFPVEDSDGIITGKRPTARLPVHFASRKTKGGEPKYAPTHLEACAVLWALDYFRHFHHGRSTLVLTDHGPLKWLMSTTSKDNSLLARYALRLQAYMPFIRIDYKPGRVNSVPDTLSRLPVDMTNDKKELDDIVIPDEFYIHTLKRIVERSASSPSTTTNAFSVSTALAHPPAPSIVTTPYKDGSLEVWEQPFRILYDDLAFIDVVKTEQDDCEGLRDMRDYLEGNARGRKLDPAIRVKCEAHRKNWVVNAGLLHRVVRVPALKTKSGITKRPAQLLMPIALPDSSPLHAQIFRAMHDHPTAAHIGEKKLAALLRSRFYWKGWENACKEYCRTCDLCQRYKALRRLRPRHVMPMHFPTPWHTINIDLIGPLPTSRGMHYAMVAIDHFSNWPEVVAIPSKEAIVVAKAIFDNVIMPHTCPVNIITDNGGEFRNEVLRHLGEMLRIQHNFTAPYHPATNGKVERFNRFLKKALAMLAANYGGKWTWYIPSLCFAYRHAPVFGSGKSPFEISRGFPGRIPLDLLTTPPEQLEIDSTRFHAQHLEHLARVWQEVAALRDENAEDWGRMADDAANVRIFAEGSYALIYMPPDVKGPAAFTTMWRGPFLVTKRLGPKTYRLQAPSTKREFSVSVDNMVSYHPRAPLLAQLNNVAEPPASQNNSFEIEEVEDVIVNAEEPVRAEPVPKQEPASRTNASSVASRSSPDLRRSSPPTSPSRSSPDLRRATSPEVSMPTPSPMPSPFVTDKDDTDNAALLADIFAGIDATKFEDMEADIDIPYSKMSFTQQQRLIKLVISIINEVNRQVEIKKSSIKGLDRRAPYGVFAKKRLRKGLVVGYYRGRLMGHEEYDIKYPDGVEPKYCLEVRPGLFVDAEDPREAGFARFINDHGPGGKPNVIFHCSKEEVLVQLLRDVLPGEELFVYYGKDFAWKDQERKRSARCDVKLVPEPGGRKRERVKHPRGGSDVKTEAALAHLHTPELSYQAPPPLPVDAPHYDDGHSDFEESSCVLYDNAEGPNWLVGEVVGVDHTSPVLEVHRYGSLGLRAGKSIDECAFKAAYIDPKDGLQVYTARPLARYRPIFDLIEFKDVLARDFYLTNKARLPMPIRKLVLLRPACDFSS
jgi:hypothetical protein